MTADEPPRRFPDCDLDESNLAGVSLAGAVFDGSRFHSATFDGTDLPIFQRLNTKQSPFILVNIFDIAAEDIPAPLDARAADANWMKRQSNYIST